MSLDGRFLRSQGQATQALDIVDGKKQSGLQQLRVDVVYVIGGSFVPTGKGAGHGNKAGSAQLSRCSPTSAPHIAGAQVSEDGRFRSDHRTRA